MRKLLLVLSALVSVIFGGVGYASFATDQTTPDAASLTSNDAGGTITVQGSHLENGGCIYTIGTTTIQESIQETPNGGSGSSSASSFATPTSPHSGNSVTIHGTPNEVGGCDYSGSGSPIHIIAEDRSKCTALMESAAPGSDPEHEKGSWASSTAAPTTAP